jgi:hypothetical protein
MCLDFVGLPSRGQTPTWICNYLPRISSGVNGILVLYTSEEAGVSNTDELVMTSVSPINTTDELPTPRIWISPTRILSFRTVIFIDIIPFLSYYANTNCRCLPIVMIPLSILRFIIRMNTHTQSTYNTIKDSIKGVLICQLS